MLRIENLHQTFHQGEVNEVQALRGVDLHVPSGQFVTIIGSNGAGKSTLFNTVAGVDTPTQGRILIDDVDVTRQAEYRARFADRPRFPESACWHRGRNDDCTEPHACSVAWE